MTAVLNVVHARNIGRSFAADPDLKLPARPRLIPELLVCTLRDGGLMFVGAQAPQVLRGRSASEVLPALLPLLDGTRTQEELGSSFPQLNRDSLDDVLSLLFSRGLLEDGIGAHAGISQETASFVGRFNDVSRRNRNRGEAMARLGAARVHVSGPESLTKELLELLADAGIFDTARRPDGRAECDLTIALSTGDHPLDAQFLRDCVDSSASTLSVRLGSREAQIGPLLIRDVTVCPSCLLRMHEHPTGAPTFSWRELLLGFVAQRVLVDLSGVGPTRRHCTFDRLSIGSESELAHGVRLAPRMPGCAACGIPGEAWSFQDARLLAWSFHESTSIPRYGDLAPKDHQAHYLVSNVKLSAEPAPALRCSETVSLPQSEPLRSGLPWVEAPTPLVSAFTVATLSTWLSHVAGESLEGDVRRRFAPTGGNLGSVRLWILAREVVGLARGVYLYNPHEHSLGAQGLFDDAELSDALRTDARLPPCIVIGAGDLAKCAQKYQAFAYRLIHFDAGVALAYAHATAPGLGLQLREYPDFDLRLTEIFRVSRRWDNPVPTFALALSDRALSEPVPCAPDCKATLVEDDLPYDFGSDVLSRLLGSTMRAPHSAGTICRGSVAMPHVASPRLRSLEHIMRMRRAVRRYSTKLPASEILESLATLAAAICSIREEAGAVASHVKPMLMVAAGWGELEQGVYEFADGRAGPLVRRAAFDGYMAQDCINQSSLARSPASLVFVGDLRSSLTQRMNRGYCDVAVSAGAMAGTSWLAACSYGLVGTAAGGVIPHGLRVVAGMDGFNECPLLAFHTGYAAEHD